MTSQEIITGYQNVIDLLFGSLDLENMSKLSDPEQEILVLIYEYNNEIKENNMMKIFSIPTDAKAMDRSDQYMQRLYLVFANGNDISIIQGQFSYGGKEGLYEIMPGDKNESMKGTDIDDFEYDSVKGHLTIEEVNTYITVLSGGNQ